MALSQQKRKKISGQHSKFIFLRFDNIGLFALIFLGAKTILTLMKGLGKGVREFKDVNEVTSRRIGNNR